MAVSRLAASFSLSINVSKFTHLNRSWGRHAKIFGWAKSAAHDRRSTSDLWPISHNIGIVDKQKSIVPIDNKNMTQNNRLQVSKESQKISRDDYVNLMVMIY